MLVLLTEHYEGKPRPLLVNTDAIRSAWPVVGSLDRTRLEYTTGATSLLIGSFDEVVASLTGVKPKPKVNQYVCGNCQHYFDTHVPAAKCPGCNSSFIRDNTSFTGMAGN